MSLKEIAPWYAAAHEELGIKETSGPQATPRIMEYFEASGGTWVKDDRTPWCGAFMGWLMADVAALPEEPLRARGWADWGQKLDKPIPGCIVVIPRGKNPKEGHVGLFVQYSEDGEWIYLLGGNQGDTVSIMRFPAKPIVALRWPPGKEIPRPADLANGSRIKKEAKQLVKVGVGTVAGGGVVTQGVPAVPDTIKESVTNAGQWKGVLTEVISFGTFLFQHWWLVLGVTLAVAGVRLMRWRKEDAVTGKTWGI